MTIPTYARTRQYRWLATLRGAYETREEYLDNQLLYSYERSPGSESLTMGVPADSIELSRDEAAVVDGRRDPTTCFCCGALLIDDPKRLRNERFDIDGRTITFTEQLLCCDSCGWWFHSNFSEQRVTIEHNKRNINESYYTATYAIRDEFDIGDDALPAGELREWLIRHPKKLPHLPHRALLNVVAEAFRYVYIDAEVSVLADAAAEEGAHISVRRGCGVPMLVRVAHDREAATAAADIARLERALNHSGVVVGKVLTLACSHSAEAQIAARASRQHIQLLTFADVAVFLQSLPRAGTERWYEVKANLDRHTYREVFASEFFSPWSFQSTVARWGDSWYYESTWGIVRDSAREPLASKLRRRARRTVPVIARVAAALLDLGERYGVRKYGQAVFPFRLTNEQIGEMVGATRPTVNAALNRLWDEYLIDMRTAYIGVRNVAGLAKVAIAGGAHTAHLPVISRQFLEKRDARRARFAQWLSALRRAAGGTSFDISDVTTDELTPYERFALYWETEKRAIADRPVTVEPFSLWSLAAELERRFVGFVLVTSFVGGRARHSRGAPRFGVLVRPERENAVRALEALEAVGARIRHLDIAVLLRDDVLLPVASGGIRIDLITSVPGVPDAFERAVPWKCGDCTVPRLWVDEPLTAGAR